MTISQTHLNITAQEMKRYQWDWKANLPRSCDLFLMLLQLIGFISGCKVDMSFFTCLCDTLDSEHGEGVMIFIVSIFEAKLVNVRHIQGSKN